VQQQAIYWGCKRFFGRISPNLPESFCATNVLPTIFLLLLVHSLFLCHVAIDLKIENLVLNNPTEKNYNKLRKKIVRSEQAQHFEYLLIVLRIEVPFTFQLLLSARNLTPS